MATTVNILKVEKNSQKTLNSVLFIELLNREDLKAFAIHNVSTALRNCTSSTPR